MSPCQKQQDLKHQRLENKLLQELGEEMDIIVSTTVQSKISSFIKLIREE